jgi:predicted acyltransferase
MTHQRFLSLDLFRGLTVALMFLVNLPGSFEHVYAPLAHAEWHGLTLADLVFPWFLVAVGAAVPLAMDARRAKGMGTVALARQILWRSLLLFALGVFLGWILRPRYTLEEIRIAGVLQRIALVYGVCGLIYLCTGARPLLLAGLAFITLLLTWFLLTQVAVPGYGAPNLEQGTNYFAWLDQHYLPGRIFRKLWDPEGFGGTLPALGSALTGAAMLCWLRQMPSARQFHSLVLTGGSCIAVAALWAQTFPLNKNLWTSSYVLMTSGLAFLLWALLLGLEQRGLFGAWLKNNIILTLGQTALTAYIIHWMLLRVLITKVNGHWIGTHIFDAASPAFSDPRLASLLLGLIYVAISIAPMAWLKRKDWLIKL